MIERRKPEPADFLRQLGVHEADFPCLLADLLGEGAVLVELLRDRDDLLARELPGGVDQALLLVGQ